jgi:hypothetical protein
MGAVIEVKYFNSFLLKKINATSPAEAPRYDGSFGIPQSIGGYPRITGYGNSIWVIEESRIRGGYNNVSTSYGARAYLAEENTQASIRKNSLIYSGIYNSRTDVNNTNVFSVGEDITKSIDPVNGSIQKLYAEDTNLIVFQENKVSKALIDKDAIYSAEGGGTVTSSNLVIGQIVSYGGEFGISENPESFAVYGYRKYFADKRRNAILRLSMNGIEEISRYGMRDFFRDEFNNIDLAAGSGRIIGGWDIHNKQYVISTRKNVNSSITDYNTLSFDEMPKGWVSFFSYDPDHIFSLRNKYYSLKNNKLYQHYSSSVNRGNFYGINNNTTVTFVFNPNVSMAKTFKTINYEGSNGWRVTSISSDLIGPDTNYDNNPFANYTFFTDIGGLIKSYYEGEYVINPSTDLPVVRADYETVFGTDKPSLTKYYAGFNRKENKYVAAIKNFSGAKENEVLFGNKISGIKGYFVTVTMSTDNSTNLGGPKELFAVSSDYVESSY